VTGPDRSARFLMLETIREYGVEQLAAAGELDGARMRHAGHLAALSEQAEGALGTAEEEGWLHRLRQDIENLRSALDWSLRSSGHTSARLGCGLGWLFYLHGHLTEGRVRLEQILQAASDVDDLLRARVVLPAGVLAWSLGEWNQARTWLDQSLELFRLPGDEVRARDRFAESLPLYRGLEDRRGIAQSLEGLAAVIFVAGRLREAARVLSAADALRAGLGAPVALSDRREYDRTLEGVKAS